MKNRSIVLTSVFGSFLLLPLAGCEDQEARRQLDAQQTLVAASMDYRHATAARLTARDEDVDRVRADLNRVLTSLRSVTTDGGPGQQAAGGLLAADALRELAAIELSEAERVEQHLAGRRAVARGQLDGITLLTARKHGREQTSAEQHRRQLDQIARAVGHLIGELTQSLNELESPIQDQARQIEGDRARVEQLQAEANTLLRRSSELGPADGFSLVEEAAALRRQADRLEYRISFREIELHREHQPRYDSLQRQIEHAEVMVGSLQQAINDLERFEQASTGDVRRLQDTISRERDTLHEQVREITERQSSSLDPRYDEARNLLGRAASEAGRAAGRLRGGEAAYARLAEVRTNESIGRLAWSRARGVENHIALLTALVEAGDVIGRRSAYAAELDEAKSRLESLRSDAIEAYQQASSGVQQLSGPAAQKAQQAGDFLELIIAAMSGEHVDPRSVQPPTHAPTDSGVAAPGGGFSSADEAIEFLSNLDHANIQANRRLIDAMHAEDRMSEAFVGLMRTMFDGLSDLEDALQEHFGATLADVFDDDDMMMDEFGIGDLSQISVGERTEDEVTLAYPDPMGAMQTLRLLRRGDEWFVDAASLSGADDAAAMEGMQGMQDFAIMMVAQMGEAIGAAMREVTRAIRAGEFATVEEVAEALMSGMMDQMQQ